MSLPPYARLFGMEIMRGADDAPTLTMPYGGTVMGRPGFLHGGAIGGLLEMAGLLTLREALGDAGVAIHPVTLTVDYMRGGREAMTHAGATIRRLGSRIANLDAIAWQDDRTRPIAAARLTFLLER